MSRISFFEKLKNKLIIRGENNPSAFVFVSILAANLLSILLSSALLLLLPENKERSFWEMIRFAFTLMVNPSGRYQYSDYPISLVITTIVVLLGMISLTGGTVGYITSVITSIIERSATNNRKLRLKNHIVILNYNHKVPSIIYDYCFDDMNSTYIVVLSEKDKSEIKAQIENVFSAHGADKKFKNIIIRKGSPVSRPELDKISLKDAANILVMTVDNEDVGSDNSADNTKNFNVSKLFMFINSYLQESDSKYNPNVLVEVPDRNIEKLIRDYPFKSDRNLCIPVNYSELLGKIIAITAIMPSLSETILHLISFEGVEFYMEETPASLSIADELKRQKSSMPVLDIQNKRVYISENENLLTALESSPHTLEKPVPETKLVPYIHSDKSKILVIGSNSKLKYILDSFVCFKNEFKDFGLSVVLMDTEENISKLEAYYSMPEYQILFDSEFSSPIVVKDVYNPLEEFAGSPLFNDINSVLFLSDDDCSEDNIDQKPLMLWSSIKCGDFLSKQNCIVEVLDMQNKEIIEKRDLDQAVVSENFISCLFAQLGKDPLRLDFIKDMITFAGDEASVNSDNELSNVINILSVKSSLFFKNYDGKLNFKSKRELIMWVYEATQHEYLPIGCVKNGISYLFSRTEGTDDGLDTAVLLPKEYNKEQVISESEIMLNPDDEIIVIKYIEK